MRNSTGTIACSGCASSAARLGHGNASVSRMANAEIRSRLILESGLGVWKVSRATIAQSDSAMSSVSGLVQVYTAITLVVGL